MIITIDGPSGTGKSTVAKGVAKKLGFTFFDTGAMYRSFTWLILKEGIDPAREEEVVSKIPNFQFEIQSEKGERKYFVNGYDVTHEIRSQKISMGASQIAVYPEVRKAMVEIQQRFGSEVDAVFEGRDMGTVVFPDADLKIFLTAKPEIRANRRYQELLQKFPDVTTTYEEILDEIKKRDETDTTREVSPLRQAADAILIDTSEMTAHQVIQRVAALNSKRKYPKMKFSYKCVYWLAKLYFKCFFRLKVYGLEHFRPGAAIIAANHVSNLDPPVLSISCPEEVHFLAKASLFEKPILGGLIKTLNSHPVAKSSSDASVLRTIVGLLTSGKKLILFPEGKRSETGDLLPLERGLGFLVQKAKCRVIPAYIQGTYQAWPRGAKLPKTFGKITVVFGSSIQAQEGRDKKLEQERIVSETEGRIKSLKEWLESGAKGAPP